MTRHWRIRTLMLVVALAALGTFLLRGLYRASYYERLLKLPLPLLVLLVAVCIFASRRSRSVGDDGTRPHLPE